MKETLDYLPNTNINLYQRSDMFKINTDTGLLGSFIKVNSNDSVLDIGTNNGALLLYASLYTSNLLVGVDIIEEACVLASKNLDLNGISNYKIINSDINNLVIDKFDVIVSNPPYFKNNNLLMTNENKFKCYARHEIYLTLESLVSFISNHLNSNGHCFIVHRADRISDIVTLFNDYGLRVKTLQFVYDVNKDNAISVLVEGILGSSTNCDVLAPIIIKR
ncbi:MAG: methyltransferase [Erysipelotrichaceae bacterium]